MGYAVEGLRVLHLLGMKESSNNKEDPKMIA